MSNKFEVQFKVVYPYTSPDQFLAMLESYGVEFPLGKQVERIPVADMGEPGWLKIIAKMDWEMADRLEMILGFDACRIYVVEDEREEEDDEEEDTDTEDEDEVDNGN